MTGLGDCTQQNSKLLATARAVSLYQAADIKPLSGLGSLNPNQRVLTQQTIENHS
jgi:hypothetical protein